tara:strand:+ start:109 stop:864 length:756 start_codon:yes stop_codon:yes gene_type:complete
MSENFLDTLKDGKGYVLSALNKKDLNTFRKIIEKSWINTISKKYPNYKKIFLNEKIFNYHKNSHKISHAEIWSKKSRTLSAKDVSEIKKITFFKDLQKKFSKLKLSDEEKIGHGIIVYRIVRPNIRKDIGPLHSDKWFWDIDKKDLRRNYDIPKGYKKIRIWFSLYANKNYGFKLVPYSQNKDYKFKKIYKDGRYKPIFNAKDYNLRPLTIDSTPGNIVIFNDNLIHGGKINKSNKTRVSAELTLFLKEYK